MKVQKIETNCKNKSMKIETKYKNKNEQYSYMNILI